MSHEDTKIYYYQLDSLRFYAALSVMLGHFCLINGDYYLLMQPQYFFAAGHEAVILFFVLSGFALTDSILNNKFIYFSYEIKRIIRIYPTYYFDVSML
jgi:peptidoglycan/LPS O-acetylase OafA/YrhL